jgi:hypothetical protein
MRKKWLCVDKSKCLFSDVKINPYVGDWGETINKLTVYCLKNHKFILKYITICDDYQNTTLCSYVEQLKSKFKYNSEINYTIEV